LDEEGDDNTAHTVSLLRSNETTLVKQLAPWSARRMLSVLAQSEPAFAFWPLFPLKYLLSGILVNISEANQTTLFFCELSLLL
jgi:hypothetical protein